MSIYAWTWLGRQLSPSLPSRPSICISAMTGGRRGGACAVCKHQRRKCEPNCELAAYFPAHRMNDFRALHLVFGVANLTKLIKANASEAGRRRAAETLTWEARWREREPSEGCYREVSCLRRDNAVLRAENAALRRQLAEQQQLLLLWSTTTSSNGSVLLPNNGGGFLPSSAHAHTMIAYRRKPASSSDAAAIAVPLPVPVRGGGGHHQAEADSRDSKSSAR